MQKLFQKNAFTVGRSLLSVWSFGESFGECSSNQSGRARTFVETADWVKCNHEGCPKLVWRVWVQRGACRVEYSGP